MREFVVPIVRGFVIPDKVNWTEVPEVVGMLVNVTSVLVTVQGEGVHPPTFPWKSVERPITIAELAVKGWPIVNWRV